MPRRTLSFKYVHTPDMTFLIHTLTGRFFAFFLRTGATDGPSEKVGKGRSPRATQIPRREREGEEEHAERVRRRRRKNSAFFLAFFPLTKRIVFTAETRSIW